MTQNENEQLATIISPSIPSSIFSSISSHRSILSGDLHPLSQLNDEYISSISVQAKENVVTNIDKTYPINIEEIDELANNNVNDNDLEEDVTSLGEKVSSMSQIRKLSVEFLEKIYKEGTTSSSSTEGEITTLKHKDLLNIEPNNPYVYSFTSHHPFSFFYGNKTFCYQSKNKNRLIVPAPTLISNEYWSKKPDLTKKGVLDGMKITDKQGLVLIDPKVSIKFRGIIGNMIKQILLAAFGNKISLLIRLFEPKCVLQRVGDYWSFANKYLVQASNPDITHLERFKLVVTFGMSGLYIPSKQLKPFNPLLGETFQGEFESGGKYYIEHVSHRPLVSRFLVMHPKYQINGFFEFVVRPESLGSVILAYMKGPVHVIFKNINQEITFNIPIVKLTNAKSEKDRGAQWTGNMSYVDVKNNYRAVVKFAENHKKTHEIRGIIFSYKFPDDYKYVYDKEMEFCKKFNLNLTKNVKVHAKVTGSWLEKIVINEHIYWNIDEDVPEWIRPVKCCLPSDGRFREDFIWLFRSFYCSKNEEERLRYESIGQEWKVLMEKFQRVERELRIKNNKKNKKK